MAGRSETINRPGRNIMIRVPAFVVILFLSLLFFSCHSKPAETNDLVTFFEESGLVVTKVQASRLDSIFSSASASGSSAPQMKTVKINGVLAGIIRLEDDEAAEEFYKIMSGMKDPGDNFPERMKKALGTPRYFLHRNFVVRAVEGVDGRDDAAEVNKIRSVLESFN